MIAVAMTLLALAALPYAGIIAVFGVATVEQVSGARRVANTIAFLALPASSIVCVALPLRAIVPARDGKYVIADRRLGIAALAPLVALLFFMAAVG